MTTAKIFWSGNSQAVRLPKEMRLPDNVLEVEVRKEGGKLIFEPLGPKEFGKDFFKVLGSMPDFKRPPQTRTKRQGLSS